MSQLPPHRIRALYDLLIHHQLYYGEVIQFNDPSGIDGYGPPFDSKDISEPSSSPILQTLLQRFVLSLPGVVQLPEAFWENVRALMKKFAEANLSDSYDHTGLGLRRTLATGGSAILEYPARGCFARSRENKGVRDRNVNDYDPRDPDDIKEAWEHFVQEMVHGDLIDELFQKIAETDELSSHSTMVQAAHEYILVNVASVLHHVFAESPDGGYLTKLVTNILGLMPWTMLRQSLRIGNAASMINAVTRLFLTKLSITSFTNWMGWSNSTNDGYNLMQQIISTIVGWDIADYQKQLRTVEGKEGAPSLDHLKEVRKYVDASREEQVKLRQKSMDRSKSIIAVIVANAGLTPLDDEGHKIALQYLAFSSSIRNREQFAKIVCKSQPDILTQTIREGVAAYEPIIRRIHSCVDLSATCWDAECFLNDFMALFQRPSSTSQQSSSPKDVESNPVTVKEIAAVLRKHQKSLHRYLHLAFKNSEEISDDYRTYVKNAAVQFQSLQAPEDQTDDFAGDMYGSLSKLVAGLSEKDQIKLEEALDNRAAYLMALDSVSDDRFRGVLKGSDDLSEGEKEIPIPGPGTYLARWASILNATPITPLKPKGEVRYGTARVHPMGAKDSTGESGAPVPNGASEMLGRLSLDDRYRWPDPPEDDKVVIDLLGKKFADLLGEIGRENWILAPDVEVSSVLKKEDGQPSAVAGLSGR